MALNKVKRVTEINPITGKEIPVKGLYSQECGTYTVRVGAMIKTLPDLEYVADFQIDGVRYRRALCKASDFAGSVKFNRETGQWDNPAFDEAKTKLAALRSEPMRRQEELARSRKAKEQVERQKAAAEAEQNRTVADLVKEYRPVIEAKVKAKSFLSIKGHLDRIEADLGSVLLADLNIKILERWQAAMKKSPRLPRVRVFNEDGTPKHKPTLPLDKLPPLSPLTVNRHVQTLKAMMTKAADWGWITGSHLTEIRKLELDDERHRRRQDFLSREEAERLIDAADLPVRPVIICALQTGMRKEEILGLRWRFVDLTHRLIHLPKTKSWEPRSLPINDRLLTALKDKSLLRSLEDDHVFLNPETKARWSDMQTPFARAVKKAKLSHRDIVFHHLRHTAASWMVMAGVPLLTVAKVLGHADIQMVMRYAHLSPGHLDKAVATLDSTPAQEDAAANITPATAG